MVKREGGRGGLGKTEAPFVSEGTIIEGLGVNLIRLFHATIRR